MKMETCSVHTMGGLLMGVAPVLRFRRQRRKDPRLGQLSLRGRVLLGFRLWFHRGFCLFGLMRMDWKELKLLSLHCKSSWPLFAFGYYSLYSICIV